MKYKIPMYLNKTAMIKNWIIECCNMKDSESIWVWFFLKKFLSKKVRFCGGGCRGEKAREGGRGNIFFSSSLTSLLKAVMVRFATVPPWNPRSTVSSFESGTVYLTEPISPLPAIVAKFITWKKTILKTNFHFCNLLL